ncbi:hypothetical protein SAMN05421870_109183 [Streptomyces qinglanensis]|uniref:Uncharacterized protein n=1 Tax=Streptomyces qinglanensis TaxID=943816 RepID=A0A1H9UW04_9ACTN|nr:hypothetical protein SAMN05421870_109183 [Streptomyces qinglanensis]
MNGKVCFRCRCCCHGVLNWRSWRSVEVSGLHATGAPGTGGETLKWRMWLVC